MVRTIPSPGRDFLFFVGSYWCLKALLGFGLNQLVGMIGVSPEVAEQITLDNELNLQTLSLFVALYAVHRLHDKGHFAVFLKSLFPRPIVLPDALGNMIGGGLLKGFLAASVSVALSLFMGFVKIEWPQWHWLTLGDLLPGLIFQMASFAFWILLVDRSFLFLRDTIVDRTRSPLESRLLVMGFAGYLFFNIFNGSPHLFDQLFTGLFCLLAAGAYLVWIEAGPLLYGEPRRAALARVTLGIGFLVSLVHVYGQMIGGNHALALMNIFQGPVRSPTGSLSNSGLAGELLFLLTVILFVNVLLRRVLRRSSSSR